MGYLLVQVILSGICGLHILLGHGVVIRPRRIEINKKQELLDICRYLWYYIYPRTSSVFMRKFHFSHGKKSLRKASMHMYIGSLMHSVDA